HGEQRNDRPPGVHAELAAEDAAVADLRPQAVALAGWQRPQALQDHRAALRVEVEGDRPVRAPRARERERAHDVGLMQRRRELALEVELAPHAISVEAEGEREHRRGGGGELAPDHATGRAGAPGRRETLARAEPAR